MRSEYEAKGDRAAMISYIGTLIDETEGEIAAIGRGGRPK